MTKYRLAKIKDKNILYSPKEDAVIKRLDVNFLGDKVYLSQKIYNHNGEYSNNFEVVELPKIFKNVSRQFNHPRRRLTCLMEKELVELAFDVADKMQGIHKKHLTLYELKAAKIFHELNNLQKKERKLINSGKINLSYMPEKELTAYGLDSDFIETI